VASFGIFVTLDGLNIDGLVHVTELGRDYFHFDQVRHALIGERRGRVFQLAGRVTVRVVRVDLERAKIDFALADEEAPGASAAPAAGTGRRIFAEPLAPENLRERKARGGKAPRDAAKTPRDDGGGRERRSPRGKRRR